MNFARLEKKMDRICRPIHLGGLSEAEMLNFILSTFVFFHKEKNVKSKKKLQTAFLKGASHG